MSGEMGALPGRKRGARVSFYRERFDAAGGTDGSFGWGSRA